MAARGQALVEMAIMLPVAMFIAIGFVEAGFLVITKEHQDRATAVVAEYAASRDDDSWRAVAAHELPGCDVSVSASGQNVLTISATCQYRPHAFPGWGGLPMTSRESAVTSELVSPSPSPEGSAS